MKVLIVARTRRGGGACIGAISFDGRSLRLVAPAGANERWGLDFDVGGVWEIEGTLPEQVVPPHVEDLVVTQRRRLAPMTDPAPFIERHMPPASGGPEALFGGMLVPQPNGYLSAAQDALPPCSTTFWRPDRPLVRREGGKRIRYHYTDGDSDTSLVFVGFQEPLPEIPAGTLLRVSLTHLWRPPDRPDAPLRSYAQLSGWFGLPVPTAQTTIVTSSPVPSAARIEQVRAAMKRVFGYDSFRPLQEQVIGSVLNRRDTLGVMPTGAGKSLCFQLPALVTGGLTVVVSPLISLMQDQVDQLRTAGVCAVSLNSMMSHAEYAASAGRIRSGEARLLYVAPETLLRPEMLLMLDHCQVTLITIDEAHCISEWGHDFRPEYRQLRTVRDRYPSAVCLALTATATERVRADVRRILGIAESDTYIAPFDRPNLRLEVRRRTGGVRQILDFIQQHEGEAGIVYCSTRKAVDLLTERLRERGIAALPYHAGMEDEDRRVNQRRFQHDEVQVIVATTAFGMGINKSNVRFVLHHAMPNSVETYYQQIGRAGRDGLPADCLLLFARADIGHAHHWIEQGAEAEKAGKIARLGAMIRYAQAAACRRAVLVTYFGDPPPEGSCSSCDNCLTESSGREAIDVSEEARLFLRCIDAIRQRFGLTHVVDVLRGSRSAKVVSRKHDALPTYGAGAHRSTAWWRLLADRLAEQAIVEVDSEFGTATITAAGRKVLAGDPFRAVMQEPKTATANAGTVQTYDALLFEALRRLRRELAEEAKVPPYVVFSDRSLTDLAAVRPTTDSAFRSIHGVGERKATAYAAPVLDVIRAFVAEHGTEIDPDRAVVTVAEDDEPRRSDESARAFQSGMSLDQIAARWSIKRDRVLYHLSRYVREGGRIDPGKILGESGLDEAMRARSLTALERLGTHALRPAFDDLEGAVSYPELRILALYLQSRSGEAK